MRFRKGRNGNRQGNHGTGKCLQQEGLNLASLAEGQEAVITSVPHMPLLPPLGLRPGKRIKVMTRGCCGGPIFAEVEQRCIALGRCVAREIQLLSLDEYVTKESGIEAHTTLTAVPAEV